MTNENIHQKALRQWITAGLAIDEVAALHGDAGYIFNNMIAKYTLANDQYAISTSALLELKRSRVDLKQTYFRRKFYGKDKRFMYEHAIPATIIRQELLGSDRTESSVQRILQSAGMVVLILRGEDVILKSKGLNASMPDGWFFGDNPNARYNLAGIELSSAKLNVKGAIVR